jgi:hypothetical protein
MVEGGVRRLVLFLVTRGNSHVALAVAVLA